MKNLRNFLFGLVFIFVSVSFIFGQSNDANPTNEVRSDSTPQGFGFSFGAIKRERRMPEIPNSLPIIIDIKLDKTEVFANSSDSKIDIFSEVFDADNDPLVFNYTVSGGKIIGNGQKVIWDLSGVEAGVYTISVVADDGCGICGEKMTKEVVVY